MPASTWRGRQTTLMTGRKRRLVMAIRRTKRALMMLRMRLMGKMEKPRTMRERETARKMMRRLVKTMQSKLMRLRKRTTMKLTTMTMRRRRRRRRRIARMVTKRTRALPCSAPSP